MRKIAIFNQKGGVGKTITTVNLAAGLSRYGKKVIIIDIDPQGDISSCHNISAKKNIYHVLMQEAGLDSAISKMGKNLDIIHSDIKLAEAEEKIIELNLGINIFDKCFTPKLDYDYVLFDCPPSMRYLNKCALFYAKEVVIPCTTDFLGYGALLKTTAEIVKFNSESNHHLLVSSIIPTMYDKRRKICNEILNMMKKEFTTLLVAEPIRIDTKLSEAPKSKKSIFSYARKSTGAEDYEKLVKLMLENENMHDTRFSAEQRESAIIDYYNNGKKRELKIVDNKVTFGVKILEHATDFVSEHIIWKGNKRARV